MEFFKGLSYNFRGLGFGLKSPRLLFLGLLRFLIVAVVTIVAAGAILYYHQEILHMVWERPESPWLTWLWRILSWLLSLILVGVAAVVSYLIAQILFGVVIMDRMSRITEARVTGSIMEPRKVSFFKVFLFLLRQEIPRTLVPVLISLLFMMGGWVLPFGPVVVFVSSLAAVIFLAWDNTDLVPARRLVPFRERLGLLARRLPFHLGFGLPFLVPGLNLILLSFAPVGATLWILSLENPPGGTPGPLAGKEQLSEPSDASGATS
ncbi:MAG: EI24 domain-containing protein [Deltaproteobacteria bacterium]|nr:EI24 domain-containing protein [Deltaproteobacteria bacterium]